MEWPLTTWSCLPKRAWALHWVAGPKLPPIGVDGPACSHSKALPASVKKAYMSHGARLNSSYSMHVPLGLPDFCRSLFDPPGIPKPLQAKLSRGEAPAALSAVGCASTHRKRPRGEVGRTSGLSSDGASAPAELPAEGHQSTEVV